MDRARSLAEAESAFAAQSVREGMRAAFLANFRDDGVFIREGWTAARAYLAPRPDAAIVLDWRPAFVEVAASGELGLSTGPWKATSRAVPGAAPSYGQFVSVWRREDGGPWKVAVDLGISHPGPALWDRALESIARTDPAAAPPSGIEQAEERFANIARERGERAAYEAMASPTIRFYRPGLAPALGKATASAHQADGGTDVAWTVERVETARSRDLGYARGYEASAAQPGIPRGYFLRAWRVEAGQWRIALDVTNPAAK